MGIGADRRDAGTAHPREGGVTINPLRTRDAVEIGDRPKPTKAQKVTAWNAANGLCWWCGKPVAMDGLDVEWDHKDPRALSGNDTADNLAPLHVRCHDAKTYGKTGDIARVAKAKRQEKLTRPKVRKASGFRGWRNMRGEIVWRDK
jgi:5-methylcytosine-specific restriction endonuclease McrA